MSFVDWAASSGLWIAYCTLAYVVTPALVRVRFGRWPYAKANVRSFYTWMDWLLGVVLIGSCVSATIEAHIGSFVLPGAIVMVCGTALRCWTIITLGPHFRIGQDTCDETHRRIETGPYRVMAHPMNLARVIVVTGWIGTRGIDAATLGTLGVSVVYLLTQGIAEERRWALHTTHSPSNDSAAGSNAGSSTGA